METLNGYGTKTFLPQIKKFKKTLQNSDCSYMGIFQYIHILIGWFTEGPGTT